jgi:hypothetical protein
MSIVHVRLPILFICEGLYYLTLGVPAFIYSTGEISVFFRISKMPNFGLLKNLIFHRIIIIYFALCALLTLFFNEINDLWAIRESIFPDLVSK